MTAISEAVTVTATAPAVLETTELSRNFTSEQVALLPVRRNITDTVVFPNAVIKQSLGRDLSLNTQTVLANVLQQQSVYGERLNQLDLRFGKVLRWDRLRVTPAVDIFNVFNRDTVLTQSNNSADWQTPQSILTARFVKFSVQLDF